MATSDPVLNSPTSQPQLGSLRCALTARADVDDLTEISKLETYVSQTQTMLFFLSDGYLASFNCVREIRAAVEQKKYAPTLPHSPALQSSGTEQTRQPHSS